VLGAVGQLLPVGLAAAISSVPITVMILILLSPRRKVAAIPFLLGCLVGMIVVVAVATLAAQALPEPRPRQPPTAAGVIEIMVGGALIGLGIRTWRRRDRSGKSDRPPTWGAAVDSLGPARALGLGLILDLRPKNLLLATVVGLQLHVASLNPGDTIMVAGLYVLIATSTVTVPIVMTILAPRRMEPRLAAAAKMLAADGPIIGAAVLIMIGIVVIGAGLQNV
jgi:threonine/homoserine/homoserine lactone efflux protein